MTKRPTGIILAGGKSRRFGRDKALVEIGGQTLLARAVKLLETCCSEIIVVGRRKVVCSSNMPLRAVEDSIPDIGPLGGILTGLTESETDLNVVLAVDMPFATPELLDQLIDSLGEADAAVPEAEGRLQPLCAVYRKRCRSTLEALLEEGKRAVYGFLDRLSISSVKLQSSDALDDVDTQEHLKEAGKRLADNES